MLAQKARAAETGSLSTQVGMQVTCNNIQFAFVS